MCRIDNQVNVEELSEILGNGWYVYPIMLNTENLNKPAIDRNKQNQIFCIHCKSKNLNLIGFDNYQIVNGYSSEWVYQCIECNKFMTVVNESE